MTVFGCALRMPIAEAMRAGSFELRTKSDGCQRRDAEGSSRAWIAMSDAGPPAPPLG